MSGLLSFAEEVVLSWFDNASSSLVESAIDFSSWVRDMSPTCSLSDALAWSGLFARGFLISWLSSVSDLWLMVLEIE